MIRCAFLPPDDPRAPKYWMWETTGALCPVVERYISGRVMSDADVIVMRSYLRQWIYSPVWWGGRSLEKLQSDVEAIATHGDIVAWLKLALQEGIDPL